MRVVLDSIILFSSLIPPHAPPHLIYQAWRARRFTLITCSVQLEEIRRASQNEEAEDPHDSRVLASADGGAADYLVTGDKKAGLLQGQRIATVRILTAAAFCRDVLRDLH